MDNGLEVVEISESVIVVESVEHLLPLREIVVVVLLHECHLEILVNDITKSLDKIFIASLKDNVLQRS